MMESINKKKTRRINLALIALLLVVIVAIAVVASVVAATSNDTEANAEQGTLDWCGENEVAISLDERDCSSTKYVDSGNSVTVMIVCGIKDDNVDGVRVRVRTKNGTAEIVSSYQRRIFLIFIENGSRLYFSIRRSAK